jgi:hypothetical protein
MVALIAAASVSQEAWNLALSIETPNTIWDWELIHQKSKFVALSRATRKEHINIISIYHVTDMELNINF